MKCPMCNQEIQESNLIGRWYMYLRGKEKEEVGKIQICGKCYVLISINDSLKELISGHHRRS